MVNRVLAVICVFGFSCTPTHDTARPQSGKECRQTATGAIAELLEVPEQNLHFANPPFELSNTLILSTPNRGETLRTQQITQREFRLEKRGDTQCVIGLVEGREIHRQKLLDCQCVNPANSQNGYN